jgi:hypothetical protein
VTAGDQRYETGDYHRAENALQLVEALGRQIEDPDLLSRLLLRLSEATEEIAYRASRGRQ